MSDTREGVRLHEVATVLALPQDSLLGHAVWVGVLDLHHVVALDAVLAAEVLHRDDEDGSLEVIEVRGLRLLRALLDTCSVTRAADRLEMSQPAASRLLARLRRTLGDELLVRTRHGHTLTSRAEALRGPVEHALRAIEEVVSAATFDPKTTTRVFRIASTDYGVVAVVARIAARFTVEAPGARIDIAPFTTDTLVHLEGAMTDIALWTDEALPQDFHYRRLFTDTYVGVLRRGHPLLRVKAKHVMGALIEYPQVIARKRSVDRW